LTEKEKGPLARAGCWKNQKSENRNTKIEIRDKFKTGKIKFKTKRPSTNEHRFTETVSATNAIASAYVGQVTESQKNKS